MGDISTELWDLRDRAYAGDVEAVTKMMTILTENPERDPQDSLGYVASHAGSKRCREQAVEGLKTLCLASPTQADNALWCLRDAGGHLGGHCKATADEREAITEFLFSLVETKNAVSPKKLLETFQNIAKQYPPPFNQEPRRKALHAARLVEQPLLKEGAQLLADKYNMNRRPNGEGSGRGFGKRTSARDVPADTWAGPRSQDD
jgi:hypothetical protein